MKYALINPNWTFQGSIYFGCREPHFPVEYGYAKALLEEKGHSVLMIDAHMEALLHKEIRARVEAFSPDFTVVTTAPSYLFWRCPPPELRSPQEIIYELRDSGGTIIAVGPHGSTTPLGTLKKLRADLLVRGEFEDVLPQIAGKQQSEWKKIPSLCFVDKKGFPVTGTPHITDLNKLPALNWPRSMVRKHYHHHHCFDASLVGVGAEMETSRGCPYRCSFCAKENFRNGYRKRPIHVVLKELDSLIARGVEYVYFIDEIFLPDKALLESLTERPVKFGIQTRIELWNLQMFESLGAAGCVSIEAGVESISEAGRRLLGRNSRLSLDELTGRLIYAKKHVSFVQANLLDIKMDDPEAIKKWRHYLLNFGVWANKPVPLFPYPGSPDYMRKWGAPDDNAWERAHAHYLDSYREFSDIQDKQPLPLSQLELGKMDLHRTVSIPEYA